MNVEQSSNPTASGSASAFLAGQLSRDAGSASAGLTPSEAREVGLDPSAAAKHVHDHPEQRDQVEKAMLSEGRFQAINDLARALAERLTGGSDETAKGSDLVPNGTVTDQDPAKRTLVGGQEAIDTENDRFALDDAYDLKVYEEADGSYTAELRTQVGFSFEDGASASWTDAEKAQYVEDYERAVEATWDGRVIGQAADGKDVTLDVNVDSRMGSGANWNANVTAIPAGDFRGSSVNPGPKRVNLDSEDVKPRTIGEESGQTAAAHEFGHMIGLNDEYAYEGAKPPDLPHVEDTPSIMNHGDNVRDRHVSQLFAIADAIIRQ